MADTRAARLRRHWLNVHLWIALSLVVLLVPISISGGLLVWHDEIDSVINPKRYAVSGPRISLQPSDYLAKAEAAVAADPTKPRAAALRSVCKALVESEDDAVASTVATMTTMGTVFTGPPYCSLVGSARAPAGDISSRRCGERGRESANPSSNNATSNKAT